MKPTLRPYQTDLVTGLADSIAKHRKVIGQLPTGGGKSIVFAAICDRFLNRNPGGRVLILVHRTELLKQARKTLLRAFSRESHPVKAGTRWIPDTQIYCGMVESAYKRLSRMPPVDLVIIDECHLNLFGKIHERFEDALIIGFTATPLSANKRKPLNDLYNDIVCGPQIAELIKAGALCQNMTIAPKEVVNRAELAVKSTGEFDEQGMATSFKRAKYIKSCLTAYEQHARGTKTLIFNVNIEHSKAVMQAFVDAGYNAQHLDGTETNYQRAAILQWFHDTPDAILCNVAVLTAGFDEPSIETVIINRATNSMPLWLQMTGRGSRPHPGKTFFRIIDMGGNAITLGDWNADRDWKDIFLNPPKPGKGGVAPCKSCPDCDAIVPSGTGKCPYCGHLWDHPEDDTLEEDLREFVVVTRGIDVQKMIEANAEKKQYYTFFQIGRKVAEKLKARLSGRALTEQDVRVALRECLALSEQWCRANSRPLNGWHRERATETLYKELRERCGWQSTEADPEPPAQAGPEAVRKPAAPAVRSLQNIQPLNLLNAI